MIDTHIHVVPPRLPGVGSLSPLLDAVLRREMHSFSSLSRAEPIFMGMEQSVSFAGKSIPAYSAVRAFLGQRGFPLQMGMIDGQLAFAEELPDENWRELRLRTPQGMVTVRRAGERLTFVTWGNADAAMLQAWNALVWAFAEVGGGAIETPEGSLPARSYAERADLPAIIRPQ